MQSFGPGNVDCGNITNSYNNTITLNETITVNSTEAEDNQIKQWLSPLEPWYRHQSVRANLVEGVGDWLVETNEFREWSGKKGMSKQTVFFCYGHPDVGKTHIRSVRKLSRKWISLTACNISSLVIDRLCNQASDKNTAVLGLYCDYLAQGEQSATNMLGAIFKQLLERGEIPKHLRRAFREGKKRFGGLAMRLPDLVQVLKMTIASLSEVFICIDALDECLPKDQRDLLESIHEIVLASPTTRLFLTGRPHIRDKVKGYFTEAITIHFAPTIRDIEGYLEMKLSRDNTPSAMDDDLRAQIMKVIPGKISPMCVETTISINQHSARVR